MSPVKAQLDELVRRYGAHVLGLCQQLVWNPADAEDLAQEVFARVCELSSKKDRDRADIPWGLVQSVLQNVFREYVRRAKRGKTVFSPRPHSANDQQSIHAPTEEEDARFVLRRCLRTLSDEEQQTIVGRHILGMSFTELAALMETPRTTLHEYYKKGIRRLRTVATQHGLSI